MIVVDVTLSVKLFLLVLTSGCSIDDLGSRRDTDELLSCWCTSTELGELGELGFS